MRRQIQMDNKGLLIKKNLLTFKVQTHQTTKLPCESDASVCNLVLWHCTVKGDDTARLMMSLFSNTSLKFVSSSSGWQNQTWMFSYFATKWPVFDVFILQQLMHLWWQRAACHFFVTSLTLKNTCSHFYRLVNKNSNQQSLKTASFSALSASLLLSNCCYSASTSFLFSICLCTYNFFCVYCCW